LVLHQSKRIQGKFPTAFSIFYHDFSLVSSLPRSSLWLFVSFLFRSTFSFLASVSVILSLFLPSFFVAAAVVVDCAASP